MEAALPLISHAKKTYLHLVLLMEHTHLHPKELFQKKNVMKCEMSQVRSHPLINLLMQLVRDFYNWDETEIFSSIEMQVLINIYR